MCAVRSRQRGEIQVDDEFTSSAGVGDLLRMTPDAPAQAEIPLGAGREGPVHEPSIRVPLIVYDPRRLVEPGEGLLDQVALNVDLAPTLLDLAGVPVPDGYEGESLVPLLDGESPPWRTDFLYEHHFAHPRIPRSEGVRGPRWTYVRYYAEEPVFEELYDRWTDPLQARNLATDPDYAAVLARQRRRCDELIEGPRW